VVTDRIPRTKAEALALLSDRQACVVAGGTDLMVKRRRWPGLAPAIPGAVFIAQIDELVFVRKEKDAVVIGACTPLAKILDHPMAPDLLKRAIAETAGPGIRHAATIAGNLANASPAADPALALVALDAVVRIEGPAGTREVPAERLATGPGRTELQPDELVTAIAIPDRAWTAAVFVKVGGRKADAISKVSFCGAAAVENGRIVCLNAAFGAVGPTILRVRDVEESLIGLTPAETAGDLPRILAAYGERIRPIDDQRSTAHYRKTVAINLLSDFILHL